MRVGSSKQTRSLGRALGGDVAFKNVEYTSLIKIPNILKFKKTGIDFKKSDDFRVSDADEAPDAIIFSGRRLAGLALHLKEQFRRQFGKNVKLISILNPNYPFKNFLCVILPVHDGKTGGNIVNIHGSLCEVDQKKLDQERNFWGEKLKERKKPYVSFMIGGDTKNKKFDDVKLGNLTKGLSEKIKEMGGTLLISSSRRTSPECVKAVENNLRCDNYFFKWDAATALNPYYGFLTLSDIIVVTGDSISMICESLIMKKSIFVYRPKESLEQKHQDFCSGLMEKKLIREIKLGEEKVEIFNSDGLNELERVKNTILTMLNLTEKL
ncbi:MAG: mitochondrial fission ELM1 family protein [Rickettsiales bacterium]|nr:mitochondrial fission ELM1 family protein [Rickettsiales bacterium]